MADRRELARTAHGRGRARARPVLHRRSALSDRADLLRGDRSGSRAGLRPGRARQSTCPRSCVSVRGWAATWTATPTCMRRRSARRSRVISRSSSINTFSTVRAWPRRCRRAQLASASRPNCRLASSTTWCCCLPPAVCRPRVTTACRIACSWVRSWSGCARRTRAEPITTRTCGDFLDDLNLIAHSLRANKGEHAGLFQVRRLHPARAHVRFPSCDARHPSERGGPSQRDRDMGSAILMAWRAVPRSASTRLREALERDEGSDQHA